jgi:hypothetical protein
MQSKGRRTSVGQYLLLGVVAIAILAAVLGGAYYQEDIGTWVRLKGWDTRGAERVVRAFVEAASRQDPGARQYLNTGLVEPIEEGGKLTAFSEPDPNGTVTVPVSRIVPSGEMKAVRSRVRLAAQVCQVIVQYSDGRWGAFDVGYADGVYRIHAVPRALTTDPPRSQDTP